MEKSNQSSSADAVKGTSGGHLCLHVKPKLIPIFFQLLGHGFSVDVQTGGNVKDLLCKQLGIHKDYLAQRIQTIFLNAKVVDDLNTAIVNEGSTLALSGAMPGLVGAILRSGGFYASMRSQISYNKNQSAPLQETGKITLKLLNLVVKELGPGFLQRGILIKGKNLYDFLYRYQAELEAGCTSGKLNAVSTNISRLLEIEWTTEPVFLQVDSEQLV
jgi:hypothetical protein